MNSRRGLPRSTFVADFETTTTIEDCRVWGWGLLPLYTNDVEFGTTIESFFHRLSSFNSVCYFHNLKFDGKFIIDWLLKNGFTHTEDDHPRTGQFTTLISKMGQFYSITVKWLHGRCEFRDSLKKIPMKVSKIAKAYKLSEVKGLINYEKVRPVDHILTAEEMEYIRNDVTIVARALEMQIDEGMTGLTVGADSLKEYRKLAGKQYGKLFPILARFVDDDIRRAYRGGFTYVSERFQGKIVGPGKVYDMNSLYPYVMNTCPLPYGEPMFFETEPPPGHPLSIFTITFTAKLKKDHIPCIQIKGSSMFNAVEYQSDISEPVTLSCTNIDLDLWSDQYDIELLEFHGGWAFHSAVGIFSKYIKKWSDIKESSTGGLRDIAKLHLNSLYGKFATNPDVTGKIPYLDGDIVRYRSGTLKERDPVYTPVGVFITSHARDITVRAAQDNYENFVYADTDSLHLIGEPNNLVIHPTRMGCWKHEYDFTRGIFTRPKCYSEEIDVSSAPGWHPPMADLVTETHIAGMPEALAQRVKIEHHLTGHRYEGKLIPKAAPGGIVLETTTFKLKP